MLPASDTLLCATNTTGAALPLAQAGGELLLASAPDAEAPWAAGELAADTTVWARVRG